VSQTLTAQDLEHAFVTLSALLSPQLSLSDYRTIRDARRIVAEIMASDGEYITEPGA
jgi:hypothetical protein